MTGPPRGALGRSSRGDRPACSGPASAADGHGVRYRAPGRSAPTGSVGLRRRGGGTARPSDRTGRRCARRGRWGRHIEGGFGCPPIRGVAIGRRAGEPPLGRPVPGPMVGRSEAPCPATGGQARRWSSVTLVSRSRCAGSPAESTGGARSLRPRPVPARSPLRRDRSSRAPDLGEGQMLPLQPADEAQTSEVLVAVLGAGPDWPDTRQAGPR